MPLEFYQKLIRRLGLAAAGAAVALGAQAAPQHGISMYGEPQLPQDFVSLPYANPDAPTGGGITTGEVGSFDSLNPHIRKGSVPWQLRFLAYESLMGRNYDEPFALYGLLAETIETGPNREWVEFTLRPEARFSDGSPVTVEDVMWSYETLGTEGHPRYHGVWSQVASMEQTGPRSLRFTFSEDNRELALVIGMRPILKKAQWQDVDFTRSGLEDIPISSAPYVISDFEAGRFVELTRDPDYWGRDLPFRRGTNNLDTIRMEFFLDGTAMFEAFRGGLLTSFRETNSEKWKTQFDFPAIASGDVVKSEIPHQRPTGMTGLVMNTRRPIFDDWRVREALLQAFNFEYINDVLSGGEQQRITSYFSNSVLGMSHDPAEGLVRDYLAPYASDLPPGTLEGYALPEGDGTVRNRGNLRKALALLDEAGWTQGDDGKLRRADGTPFAFEILLNSGASEPIAIAEIYQQALERLGVSVTIALADKAQFNERVRAYDFDMTWYRWGLSLSPGSEQRYYWGCDGVTAAGSRNLMGLCSEAAEAMIDKIVNAETRDGFLAATHALDRVLTAGRYVIPTGTGTVSWIAHDAGLKYPEHLPIYGDWIGWQPDVWWFED